MTHVRMPPGIVVEPGVVVQSGNPLLLTMEGEFVAKNLVLLSVGIVVGSTVRRRRRPEPSAGSTNA